MIPRRHIGGGRLSRPGLILTTLAARPAQTWIVHPMMTPDMSPKLSPDMSPKLSPDMSPKLSPDLSPKASAAALPALTRPRGVDQVYQAYQVDQVYQVWREGPVMMKSAHQASMDFPLHYHQASREFHQV